MSAVQFQDWMKTESPTSDYCITCGAPVGPDGEFQEQAAIVQGVGLSFVLRGLFETMRVMSDGDRFLLSEKICCPALSCEQLRDRFSARYRRAITRQAIHRRLTKLAHKMPELQAFLFPSGKIG